MCWCDSRKRTPWCDNCRRLAPPERLVSPPAPAAREPFDGLRRRDSLRHTRAEAAILNAIREVEDMPADPRLTSAVVMLARAQERVADFVDNVI